MEGGGVMKEDLWVRWLPLFFSSSFSRTVLSFSFFPNFFFFLLLTVFHISDVFSSLSAFLGTTECVCVVGNLLLLFIMLCYVVCVHLLCQNFIREDEREGPARERERKREETHNERRKEKVIANKLSPLPSSLPSPSPLPPPLPPVTCPPLFFFSSWSRRDQALGEEREEENEKRRK